MMRIENDCVGPCPQGCIGSACRYRNVLHFYCDECGEEVDTLYTDGYECKLCRNCAAKEMNGIISQMSFDEMAEMLGFEEVAIENWQ